MPTTLARGLELPPYAADVDDHPIVIPRRPRHFGQGDPERSRRAMREIVVGGAAAAIACLALCLVLLGDGPLARLSQVVLCGLAAVLGTVAGFAHWYRSTPGTG